MAKPKIKCPKCGKEFDQRGLPFHLQNAHDLRKSEIADALRKTGSPTPNPPDHHSSQFHEDPNPKPPKEEPKKNEPRKSPSPKPDPAPKPGESRPWYKIF